MNVFNKNIVSVHAHPDDTEIFCAGTLELLIKEGFNVTIVTMTAGGMGGIGSNESKTIRTRKKEAEKAAHVLGADYICLSGRDGYLYDSTKLRLDTLRIIRRAKAGVVFTHLPMDYHSDHRTTCNIVESAAMLATLPNVPIKEKPLEITPLLYHTAPLGLSDPLGKPITDPHFYIDITSVIEKKMSMLKEHVSQQVLMRVMHKMEDFYGEMRKANLELGKRAGCEYAEAFWQHLGGGFQKQDLIQNVLQKYVRTEKKQ